MDRQSINTIYVYLHNYFLLLYSLQCGTIFVLIWKTLTCSCDDFSVDKVKVNWNPVIFEVIMFFWHFTWDNFHGLVTTKLGKDFLFISIFIFTVETFYTLFVSCRMIISRVDQGGPRQQMTRSPDRRMLSTAW